MWSHGIVLHEPLGQTSVEHGRIRHIVPEPEEFFPERPIEPLVPWIVLGGLRTAPPVRETEPLEFRLEMLPELASVVGMDMDDVPVEEVPEPPEEIRRTERGMARVHPCIGDS